MHLFPVFFSLCSFKKIPLPLLATATSASRDCIQSHSVERRAPTRPEPAQTRASSLEQLKPLAVHSFKLLFVQTAESLRGKLVSGRGDDEDDDDEDVSLNAKSRFEELDPGSLCTIVF